MTKPDDGIRRAFVIGHPISHSRSPALHAHWLARHDIAGSYQAVDVSPRDLKTFISTMREAGFVGGNVTLPHKESIAALVYERDETAIRIGAVNTLWLQDDKLIGGNTDSHGFLANLDQSAPGWDQTRSAATALILGAGGAARAVATALADRGISRIAIANRTPERAEALCRHCRAVFPQTVFEMVPWESRAGFLAETQLLVNTTSLGMVGQPPLDLPLGELPEETVINDLVYNPLKTELLSGGLARGNRVVDGLGMLLHQAVPGFARWFGVTPVVDDDLRQAVLSA
jgi:shikimate dehydrogenase